MMTKFAGENMSETKQMIQVAYEAAKRGDRPYARQILQQIVLSERASSQLESAWYLYAHIAENRQEAIYCLQKTLELNPNNERARRELDKLQAHQPAPIIAPAPEPRLPSSFSADSHPAPTPEPKQNAPGKPQPKKSSFNAEILLWAGGGIFALCLLAVAAYFLFGTYVTAAPPPPTTIPTVAIPPTIQSDCTCDQVNAYLEKTGSRYMSLEQDALYLDEAFTHGTVGSVDYAALSGKARTIYKEQVAETPPPCLEGFHSKTVSLFWNWQQTMEYLGAGQYDAAQVFIDGFFEQITALEAEAQSVRDAIQGCPGNGFTDPTF
jgi:tetratricopeptide (TPR) repeat protein